MARERETELGFWCVWRIIVGNLVEVAAAIIFLIKRKRGRC